MATTLKANTNFPATLVSEMFSKVAGRSAIAKLSRQTPIPFNGIEEFVFALDSEAQIVGEGEAKGAGTATTTPKVIRPVKFVYQARTSDEFLRASAEARIPTLQTFADGFAKKISRGFDIAAFHGLEESDLVGVLQLVVECGFHGVVVLIRDESGGEGAGGAVLAADQAGGDVLEHRIVRGDLMIGVLAGMRFVNLHGGHSLVRSIVEISSTASRSAGAQSSSGMFFGASQRISSCSVKRGEPAMRWHTNVVSVTVPKS